MDTLQSIIIYALSVLLFLVGVYALLFAWLPVPARPLENRMSRGAGARIAALVFALTLPQVLFLAPTLGRGDASSEGEREHTKAVLGIGRELHDLAEGNIRDREETEESLQRRESRVTEMARLNERLKVTQQEHAAQLAHLEAGATRSWQWRIVAVCFGLGGAHRPLHRQGDARARVSIPAEGRDVSESVTPAEPAAAPDRGGMKGKKGPNSPRRRGRWAGSSTALMLEVRDASTLTQC
jgi:hypothetical protein